MTVIKAILSGLYSFALRIRHWLYDARIIKGVRADVAVVCVGNLTVGGTGKTPVVEYLIEHLSERYNVAVISLGYKRKSKGYREVDINSSFLEVGDEPKQIKRKFPRIVVAVCKDRNDGIRRVREKYPEINMIIMDDGFQYRKVEPSLNIILMDYTRPIYKDHMLPWGRLRDLPSQIRRAGIVMVTKTPSKMSPIDRRIVVKNLGLYPYQSLFFTQMTHGVLTPIFPDVAQSSPITRNVVVMSGIGNPSAMIASLKDRYNVVDTFTFPDHHVYRVKDLRQIVAKLKELPADTIIITTEKDGVKLTSRKQVPVEIQKKLYFIPVKLTFPEGDDNNFIKTIYKDVKAN